MLKKKAPEVETVSTDRKLRQLFDSVGILPKWYDCTFDDFTNDAAAKKAVLQYLSKCDEALKEGIGLYLYGTNGVGKTLLSMCLLKSLLLDRKKRVRTIALGDLIDLYAGKWRGEGDGFRDVMNVPFLHLEEVGKEYKSGENDLGRTVLDTLVRHRLQCKRPMLFSTNLEPKQIEATYTHDIASMMFECVVPVKVTGMDFRKEVAQPKIRKIIGL